MLSQATDFRDESEALNAVLEPLSDADFARPTLFKGWTINDIITHLHTWNRAALLSLTDESAFAEFFAGVGPAFVKGTLRDFEREFAGGETGGSLRRCWRDFYLSMAERFEASDPKARVKWAGPDMSVRSSITARLMETWAHGQAVYDLLGVERRDADRIRNIAILGINTYGWSFKVRGQEPPGPPPLVRLSAPSGADWEWHADNSGDSIVGTATEFCQVVTQVRNVADTGLEVTGPAATAWMQNAQCFAGPPEAPPAPGVRHAASK